MTPLRAVATRAVTEPRHWPLRKVAAIAVPLLLLGALGITLGLLAHAHHTYRTVVQTATVGAQPATVHAAPTDPQNTIALVTCVCGVVATLTGVGTFVVSLRKAPAS